MRTRPFGAVITPADARLSGMSTSTPALMSVPAPSAPSAPTDEPAQSVEDLQARLDQLNARLAVATAERDAYRDALVRVRLAMHGMPSL